MTAVHDPQRGSKGLGSRVTGPARVLVLPVVDQAGPSLGLDRPPGHRVEKPGHHRDHRVRPDPVSLVQPADPPLQGAAPARPVGRQPELLDQAGSGADVLGRDGILQRVLGQAAALAPGGGAALHGRGQSGFAAFQLGPEHVAEQVMVAVPLPAVIQRHQQQVRPGQLGQRCGGSGKVQRGFAQRAGHAVEHRGPGQELPLTGGDQRQQLRFDILAHELVIATERGRRARQRAALPHRQRRQVQPGRPPLGTPVQAGQVIVADLHLRVAQQHARFLAGQRQVGRADLGDPPRRTQPRDPKRRLVAPGQHQAPRPGT